MGLHRYCCQNSAQNFLDHMIDVPDNFSVGAKSLNGIDKSEYIQGFKELTFFVRKIYSDMVRDPDGYGLPLVEDIEYKPANPKASDSKNSVHRFIALLYLIAKCGSLNNGEITVIKSDFVSSTKAIKPMFKPTNAAKMVDKLNQHGLVIEGFKDKKCDSFKVYYPNSRVVINALFGYMNGIDGIDQNNRDPLFALHYYLATPPANLPENNDLITFSEYFSTNHRERDFFVKLDSALCSIGLVGETNLGYRYLREYSKKEKGRQASITYVRCFSEYGRLKVYFKLNYLSMYIDFIKTLPNHIQQVFDINSACGLCKEQCNYRKQYEFNGKDILTCGFQYSFATKHYDAKDVEYYALILKHEIEARAIAK